ncbi:hypothetical protein KIPB_011228, partial [Kipferlia bialata]|eukprot:g11228.t1
MRVHLDAYSS